MYIDICANIIKYIYIQMIIRACCMTYFHVWLVRNRQSLVLWLLHVYVLLVFLNIILNICLPIALSFPSFVHVLADLV